MSGEDKVINYRREIESSYWTGGHRRGNIEIEEEVISTGIEKKRRENDSGPWNTKKGEMIKRDMVIIQIQVLKRCVLWTVVKDWTLVGRLVFKNWM